jgi:hypothetical protein
VVISREIKTFVCEIIFHITRATYFLKILRLSYRSAFPQTRVHLYEVPANKTVQLNTEWKREVMKNRYHITGIRIRMTLTYKQWRGLRKDC